MTKVEKFHKHKYIYTFIYDNTESALCKLESRYLFNEEEDDKLLFSNIMIEPLSSAFIKNRLEIIAFSDDYTTLINSIEEEKICIEGFKVEYIVFDGDTTHYDKRLEKLKDVGYSIEGIPDYYHPTITYGLCCYDGMWCFGMLNKDDFAWYKHKQKPHSYSNSINVNIAKALVNIASRGNRDMRLLDACCGAGTIMLEACFAGFKIEGCDINWKLCRAARANLVHFDYKASIYRSDIKNILESYDAAIIDLPYNLLSSATDDDVSYIIQSTAEITDRFVIVSIKDITKIIHKIGLKITDYCEVSKRGKTSFARKIWVCEKI